MSVFPVSKHHSRSTHRWSESCILNTPNTVAKKKQTKYLFSVTIQFQPLVDPARVHQVHHILIRLCDYTFKGAAANQSTKPYDCLSKAPEDTEIRDGAANCLIYILYAWGNGGSANFMRKDVGIRLTPQDSGRYFILETHYNNPALRKHMLDSSGVRVLLMDQPVLRSQEAAEFWVGSYFGPGVIIPSEQTTFTVPSVCTPECTRKFVPKGGVTAFSVLLHSHLAGRSLALRHFRFLNTDGKEVELAPIAADPGYDFNYQQWRPINVTILPGDRLVMECNYSTVGRPTTVLGGESTHSEMCLSFVFTTPPIPFAECISATSFGSIFNAIDERPLDYGGVNSLPQIQYNEQNNPDAKYGTDQYDHDRAQLENIRGKAINWTAEGLDGQTKAENLQAFYKNEP